MISDNKELLTISDTLSYFWKNKITFLIILSSSLVQVFFTL
jgi:hypothetical protein